MNTQTVWLRTLRYEALGIASLELLPEPGTSLAGFDAGAHIDVHLPNGLVRSYSLLNDPRETHRYCLGVLEDKASRGGSRCVHEQLKVGMRLQVSKPSNNFALQEGARHSVLIAGGIGITPLLSMACHLQASAKPFDFIYLARSRASAAFQERVQELAPHAQLRFDDEAGGPPDMHALLSAYPPDSGRHFYACGPAVMLDAFETQSAALGHEHAHIERFAAVQVAAAKDAKSDYQVELRRTGKFITVTAQDNLLETLLAAGAAVESSCREGVCGTCETRVLSGQPDHRDAILSAKERAENKTMMVCVSGCKSDLLVLDC
jgi:tetrachlorobenzoquinone reductase